jgi:hypothetical protein
MTKRLRTLIVGFVVLVVVGALAACSSGLATEDPPGTVTPSTTAGLARFPQSARYMADVQADGKTMVIGISLDAKQVNAYACTDTGDEAWFFGDQTDGTVHINSKFGDTLSASFNGHTVTGDLTMNGTTYTFTAAAASVPARMYTAAVMVSKGRGSAGLTGQ